MGNKIQKVIPDDTKHINPNIIQSPSILQKQTNKYSIIFYYNITNLYYFIEGYEISFDAEQKCNEYNKVENKYEILHKLRPYVDWNTDTKGIFEIISKY